MWNEIFANYPALRPKSNCSHVPVFMCELCRMWQSIELSFSSEVPCLVFQHFGYCWCVCIGEAQEKFHKKSIKCVVTNIIIFCSAYRANKVQQTNETRTWGNEKISLKMLICLNTAYPTQCPKLVAWKMNPSLGSFGRIFKQFKWKNFDACLCMQRGEFNRMLIGKCFKLCWKRLCIKKLKIVCIKRFN